MIDFVLFKRFFILLKFFSLRPVATLEAVFYFDIDFCFGKRCFSEGRVSLS